MGADIIVAQMIGTLGCGIAAGKHRQLKYEYED